MAQPQYTAKVKSRECLTAVSISLALVGSCCACGVFTSSPSIPRAKQTAPQAPAVAAPALAPLPPTPPPLLEKKATTRKPASTAKSASSQPATTARQERPAPPPPAPAQARERYTPPPTPSYSHASGCCKACRTGCARAETPASPAARRAGRGRGARAEQRGEQF